MNESQSMSIRARINRFRGLSQPLREWRSTNWIGVAGTSRVLHDAPGEDAVPWKAKVGRVWKAIFDILNGETSIYNEESWFDLRQTHVPGFLLMIK